MLIKTFHLENISKILSINKKYFLLLIIVAFFAAEGVICQAPYQATGVKIGEVTQHSAIIWTRLTKNPERNTNGIPFEEIKSLRSKEDPSHYIYEKPQIAVGHTLNEMKNTVPGEAGQVRVQYWVKGNKEKTLKNTSWENVDTSKDYTRHIKLTGLLPWTNYEFITESKDENSNDVNIDGIVSGNFKTSPEADKSEPLKFSVITCQAYHQRDDDFNGHKIYNVLNKFRPDFFVMTGDIVYYDRKAPIAVTPALARFKWNRMYSLPYQLEFHKHVSSYFIKDDHDTWQDDCWPGMVNNKMGEFTFKEGQKIFLEQVPMSDKTYRTFRWGKDLQIWLVEGRDFRVPNTTPDGPDKTIWGKEQKEWFKQTVSESDATFKLLISPTPLVGPDRVKKNDNHANKGFKHEGDELRDFISKQKNMFVVCGDRHWQYVTVDPETGVMEFATGSTTDEHAGGFSMDLREPMHRYLNIVGGFLWGAIEQIDGVPTLTFRHYNVDGKVIHKEVISAQ